jgi:methylmalonyl-CoA mutase
MFDDFKKPTYDEWRAVTEKSLKGANFEKQLTTRTPEDITLQPLYFDADGIQHALTAPGAFPYVRGIHAEPRPWHIAQELPAPTPQDFNTMLVADMARGQTAVNIPLDDPSRAGTDPDQAEPGAVGAVGVSLASAADYQAALAGIPLDETPVTVHAPVSALAHAALLVAAADLPPGEINGAVGYDPLGVLAAVGSLPVSLERLYDEAGSLLVWAVQAAPGLHTFHFDLTPYADAGASAVQELAYALATGVDALRAMVARGLDPMAVFKHSRFTFALGANFFMEIAKLRAFRGLWAQVGAAYGVPPEFCKAYVYGRTGRYNKTLYDPYVNMLRTTTEALAGAISNLEGMHVAPFDEIIRQPDEFSRRVARNQQIILQQEVNLTALLDPAGGSYYVETLTDELGGAAWEAFQQIEAEGGMAQALLRGDVQKAVAEVAEGRMKAFAKRKTRLVGTNMYPNLGEPRVTADDLETDVIHQTRVKAIQSARPEKAPDPLTDFSAAVAAAENGATLGQLIPALRSADETTGPTVEPLCIQRLAVPFETLRRGAEAYADANGHPPRIFLANIGPLKRHKPRTDFTRGFFEVGGFEIIDPTGFDSASAAAQAAQDSGASVTVICGNDDDYADFVPAYAEAVKPGMTVILAGRPSEDLADLVDDAIYLGADCYAINRQLHKRLGIEKS